MVDGLPAPQAALRDFRLLAAVSRRCICAFGPVARGGIRWSDRPQDFRTEVLGLVKAQQVKNAVIVPVGAKGGFVPKLLPAGDTREADTGRGHGGLQTLHLARLLDITDNLEARRA